MISSVGVWVKNIIMVVLFASFMELLLPNSHMQRFVRVIMGLLIMLAVLNPLLELFDNHHFDAMLTNQNKLFANSSGTSQMKHSIETLTQEKEKLSLDVYKKDLSQQIRSLVTSVEGVKDAQVEVELSPHATDHSLVVITVSIRPSSLGRQKDIAPVVPVAVGGRDSTGNQTAVSPELCEKIRQTIAALYPVDKKHIEVKLWMEESS